MKTITVCGSFKFAKEMETITERLELEGNCMLTPIKLTRPNKESYTKEEGLIIEQMHKEKIKISDAILVVNVNGYIGKSTKEEIDYATSLNKEIIYYTDLIKNGVEEDEVSKEENNLPIEIEPVFEEYVDFETFSKSDFRAVKIIDCKEVPKSKKLLEFTLNDGTGEYRTILSGIHAYYEPEALIGKTAIAILNLPPRSMMGKVSNGMLLSAIHTSNGEEKLNLLLVDDKIPAGAKLY